MARAATSMAFGGFRALIAEVPRFPTVVAVVSLRLSGGMAPLQIISAHLRAGRAWRSVVCPPVSAWMASPIFVWDPAAGYLCPCPCPQGLCLMRLCHFIGSFASLGAPLGWALLCWIIASSSASSSLQFRMQYEARLSEGIIFFAMGVESFVLSASLLLVFYGLHVCLIIYPLFIAFETPFCLCFPGHFCFIVCCLHIAHMCMVSLFIELSITVSFGDLSCRMRPEVIHDNEVQLDVCVCEACVLHFVGDILSHTRLSCCGTIFFMV